MDLLQRLRSGLKATRSLLGEKFTAVGWTVTPETLEEALLASDVGIEAAETVARDFDVARRRGQVTPGGEQAWLLARVQAMLTIDDGGVRRGKPHVTLVVGVNGTGKTTTAAKLAGKARRVAGRRCWSRRTRSGRPPSSNSRPGAKGCLCRF